MACFTPNVIEFHALPTGGIGSRFLGGAAFYTSGELYYDSPVDRRILVPCGRCAGCRMDKARNWADRMLIELRDMEYKAIFVTLTYDNKHVPKVREFDDWTMYARGFKDDLTLSVRDCQLFFKRLRKAFPGRKIRYFLAGEYGPKTRRPHYHAIIYGLTLADFGDLQHLQDNDLGQPLFKSDRFAKIWGNGFTSLAVVNWNTCAYVARYTMKKMYKDDGSDGYVQGQLPEFCIQSRRPGIGLLHAEEMLAKGDKAFIRDEHGVHEVYLGRPFVRSARNKHISVVTQASRDGSLSAELADKEFEVIDKYSQIMYQRSVNSIERSISQLRAAGCTVSEFYRAKELHFLDRIKLLPARAEFVQDE